MAADAGLMRHGEDRVGGGRSSRGPPVFGTGFFFSGVFAPQEGERSGGFGPLVGAGGGEINSGQ